MKNATKYGNMTQDHVMHLLLVSGARPGSPHLPPHPHRPLARLTADVQRGLRRLVKQHKCGP